MATSKQVLHTLRKQLNDAGASLVFQGEALIHLNYFGTKEGYDKTDLEATILRELISIWTTNNFSLDNLNRVIGANAGDIYNVFDRIRSIKNYGKYGTLIELDNYLKANRGTDFLNSREQEAQETETELNRATAKAEADIKEKDNIISDRDKQIADLKEQLKKHDADDAEQLRLLRQQVADKQVELNQRTAELNESERERTIYDNAFTPTMFPSEADTAQTVYNWWNEVWSVWNSDFKAKYTFLIASKLKEIKKDLDAKEAVEKKLIDLNKVEIKKRTELFWEDLNLDNNEVNDIYGDKDKNYLDLLKDLKGESDPEQVINAFRVVALVGASLKAKAKSAELEAKTGMTSTAKKRWLRHFEKLGEIWDLTDKEIKEAGEIVEVNNPLYLPVINQKQDYRDIVNNIIKLWMTK